MLVQMVPTVSGGRLADDGCFEIAELVQDGESGAVVFGVVPERFVLSMDLLFVDRLRVEVVFVLKLESFILF